MITPSPDSDAQLSAQVDQWLEHYSLQLRITEVGTVISIGDGIAWIDQLPSATMDEILLFADGSHGLVFELAQDMIGVILLHESPTLTAGTAVYRSHHTMDMPVGDSLLGRIIDPLGLPLDGGDIPATHERQPLESRSPGITARDTVNEPLYTGSRVIDTLIPIGKGQRQLIVGDKGLGRSSLAIDTIIHHKNTDVRCVYVLIGQKRSTIVNTIQLLRDHGALDYTTVVVAEASSLPGLQYLAPFAGCAIAEHWMHQGEDTLVVYDDLSTHARTYRELSLLLRRPPGREAYPGDIFYVHARLLERATCLNAAQGGGSMTALPIIETQQGEIAAYIPTNLISITDGQIYLERDLFVSGFRPAIDIAKSVSRIGGRAQHQRIKEEAARIKLRYLQFLELEVFTRFGARLEATMQLAIKHGQMLRTLFKQPRLSPEKPEFHLAWLMAFNEGLLDDIPIKRLPPVMDELERQVSMSLLNLDTPREQWQQALKSWLADTPPKAAPETP